MKEKLFDKEKALELWFEGKLDKEIALELGCVNKTVWAWRKKNDLPSNQNIFNWDKSVKVKEKTT